MTEQEFWEWCGFTLLSNNWCEAPDRLGYARRLPKLTLDNLFKYAVPKLYELGWSYELKGYTYHTVDLYRNERRISSKGLKDPTQALYQAICEVIENENKTAL